jgi:probable FeS assembly SUF system protein SufT
MAAEPEIKLLARDVEGIEIPIGERLKLPAGTPVRVMQALGDTLTLVVDEAFLVRIAAADGDALGLEPPEPEARPAGATLEDRIWQQLRTCFDPEIPADIVALGLVYGLKLEPLEDGQQRVRVELTLTAPGCGMGDVLCADVIRKLGALDGVADVEVEVVLDPPWDPSRMSEAARLQLGLL